MNVTLLIDSIVRQTTVLIAELATSGGLRAPLSHVADQVFLDLARELESQGLSRKVTADMFGLALRTYQRKMQRLTESESDRGRTLWEAVYNFVRSKEVTTRREILNRFRGDEEALVRGVLTDLVESGLLFATGPTQDTSFRAATDRELGAMAAAGSAGSDEMIWALVFRTGPVSAASLATLSGASRAQVDAALERLLEAKRIEHGDEEEPMYRTSRFFVPIGAPAGWEAAVFDHYHAVVRTIAAKLRNAVGKTSIDDAIGGSTYSFEIWQGHPLAHEVTTCLRRFREQHSALRERVRAYNRSHPKPETRQGVVVYGGQCVWEIEDDEATSK